MQPPAADSPRRSARPAAAPPARTQLINSPSLWWDIVRAAEQCSIPRARLALESADDDVIASAMASPLGIITPIIRVAGQKGRAGDTLVLPYVQLALERDFDPDVGSPHLATPEIRTPPIVAAASYGFTQVLHALLEAGASPTAVDTDLDNVFHASLLHPRCIEFLLRHPRLAGVRSQLVSSPNKFGRSPLIGALCVEPFKACLKQSAALLAPYVVLSDDDFRILTQHSGAKHLKRLMALCNAATPSRCWAPSSHWSFPASDRFAMRHLFEMARRGFGPLPPELWCVVFSFVERGWFLHDADGRAGGRSSTIPLLALGGGAASRAASRAAARECRRARFTAGPARVNFQGPPLP